MEYQVVFDASQKSFPWWFPAIGISVAFIALLMLVATYQGWFGLRAYQTRRQAKIIGVVICVIAVSFSIMSILITYFQHERIQNFRESGQVSIVEGRVENFVPMPYEGKALESFTINGVKFEYSDFVYSYGFNNTSSHGGPIREGLQVRIHYVGNTILKLEIKK